jgi:hypothetical protein
MKYGGRYPMPHKSLEEIYKLYEFNKTEPETLSCLIKSAIEKSDGIRNNFELCKDLARTIHEIFVRENFVHSLEVSSEDVEREMGCVGIDGSFQCVGGLGGIWYTPISCSRILFKGFMDNNPEVEVAADIHDINEIEYPAVEKEAEFRMLVGETKAINEWLSKGALSPQKVTVFIDGPIVDPPWFSSDKRYKEYLEDRCDVIKRCIEKNVLLIGCVKRIFGRYLINNIRDKLAKNDQEKERAKQFISDAHLISFVFTKLSMEHPNKVFHTTPISVSTTDETHEAYLKEGIDVFTVFMQKDLTSAPTRLDIPVLCGKSSDISERTAKAVKISALWTLPGQNWPLPIILAHYKCNIRKGCAEVLYNEMITRTTSPNLFDNIVKVKQEVRT